MAETPTHAVNAASADGSGRTPAPPELKQVPSAQTAEPHACEPRAQSDASHPRGLSVVGIDKAYDGRKVLNDISLDVAHGQVVGLLGPNGAGKTLCFYSIIGLVRPDAGRILLNGLDVTKLPMYRRARLGLGYLPQEPSIFRGMTVSQNIEAVLELVEPDRDARGRRLNALLEEFRIESLRDTPAKSLSGGERRRCEIARAMAADPTIILLDEPFAGIDPLSIADLERMVRDLKKHDVGVLITDHNVRETLELVDRAYILYEGALLTQGTPAQLVLDANVRRLYLGEGFSL
ncbi:LPS export ABC transporter ATP-binding protein [Sphingomonas histidinilytica]|uniref:LPS export ABC transporter ATP-binding protein n=1 Tax=Rhizorhapis sp. SPR117 TaxID=2912611 RepID=UPI0007706AB7|nr:MULTISPECIES: LPS export ABC transporter ATP-binding protein [Sphingomonadaceae]AMK22989.1 ABC transporter-like protein [Sphingobium sp. TKS]MBO9378729.1 LPS export ABC transporter ATP-binding protein [Rhizorhabdus histidinilytica]MCF8706725.1 LPS export ABC transporter ATP-binding protein [Rhizorhapis sp. SPR117]